MSKITRKCSIAVTVDMNRLESIFPDSHGPMNRSYTDVEDLLKLDVALATPSSTVVDNSVWVLLENPDMLLLSSDRYASLVVVCK